MYSREVVDTITGIEETVITCPYCEMEFVVKLLTRTSEDDPDIFDALEILGISYDSDREYGVFFYKQVPEFCPYCGERLEWENDE